MLFGPDILIFKAALMIAAAAPLENGCKADKPPAIAVKVETADIFYDYSRAAKDLSRMKVDTVSPYAPGSDTVSGGLREDKPEIRTQIGWQMKYSPRKNIGCLSYDKIDITIRLHPKIYIAREFNTGVCRDAILQHERRHVAVDRQVMNKYADLIGRAVQTTVTGADTWGPFKLEEQERIKKASSLPVENAVNAQIAVMQQEMRRLQAQVDTLEEYKRVSSYCRDIKFPTER